MEEVEAGRALPSAIVEQPPEIRKEPGSVSTRSFEMLEIFLKITQSASPVSEKLAESVRRTGLPTTVDVHAICISLRAPAVAVVPPMSMLSGVLIILPSCLVSDTCGAVLRITMTISQLVEGDAFEIWLSSRVRSVSPLLTMSAGIPARAHARDGCNSQIISRSRHGGSCPIVRYRTWYISVQPFIEAKSAPESGQRQDTIWVCRCLGCVWLNGANTIDRDVLARAVFHHRVPPKRPCSTIVEHLLVLSCAEYLIA